MIMLIKFHAFIILRPERTMRRKEQVCLQATMFPRIFEAENKRTLSCSNLVEISKEKQGLLPFRARFK